MLTREKPEFTFEVQLGRYVVSFVWGELDHVRLWSENDTVPVVRTLKAWWSSGGRWNASTTCLLADHHEQVKMINAAFKLAVPTIMDDTQFWNEWTIINELIEAKSLYGYMLKLVRVDLDGEHDEFAPTAQDIYRASRASGHRRRI